MDITKVNLLLMGFELGLLLVQGPYTGDRRDNGFKSLQYSLAEDVVCQEVSGGRAPRTYLPEPDDLVHGGELGGPEGAVVVRILEGLDGPKERDQ